MSDENESLDPWALAGDFKVRSCAGIESKADLKDAIEAFVGEDRGDLLLRPLKEISRYYNRVATKVGTTTAQAVQELHDEQRVFSYRHRLTGGTYVASAGIARSIARNAETHEISFNESFDRAIRGYKANFEAMKNPT